jgi:hypothetical protein
MQVADANTAAMHVVSDVKHMATTEGPGSSCAAKQDIRQARLAQTSSTEARYKEFGAPVLPSGDAVASAHADRHCMTTTCDVETDAREPTRRQQSPLPRVSQVAPGKSFAVTDKAITEGKHPGKSDSMVRRLPASKVLFGQSDACEGELLVKKYVQNNHDLIRELQERVMMHLKDDPDATGVRKDK